MKRHLVIVESPAKVKSISKYLGKNFVVKSSIGHVRDLPKVSQFKENEKKSSSAAANAALQWPDKNAERLAKRMAVDPFHDWSAQYAIDPAKLHVVKELTQLAKQTDCIYLATDMDREGEAIAWHLQEILGGDSKRYQRVTFNAITKSAIQKAFEDPRALNMDRVHAQQTRRFLDRVVGFMLSPLLWKKICKNLSAGRVQSPAVRLVVEREMAIKNFTAVTSFGIMAYLGMNSGPFLGCELKKISGAPFKCYILEKSLALVKGLQTAHFRITAIEKKPFFSKPPAPFTTSTLQQAASARLNFSVKKSMTLAQRLYEAGCITYMRTDSTHISTEALNQVRKWITENYAAPYLPAEAYRYASKGNAQEAHEAIRPTELDRSAQEIEEQFDAATARLYALIWKRFVASQMTMAEYENSKVLIEAAAIDERCEFQIKGQRLIFDGWTRIYPENQDDAVHIPTEWRVQQDLTLEKIMPKKCVTRPPARYTEASLVKELDKRGIGRPSTYESIIETIQKRGYVQIKERRFYALKLGEITSALLNQRFEPWISYDFTAEMETSLDAIAHGKKEWKKVLDEFFFPFAQKVTEAAAPPEKGGLNSVKNLELLDLHCPNCQRHFLLHVNAFGLFLACSGYKDSLSPCKKVFSLRPLPQQTELPDPDKDGEFLEKEFEPAELASEPKVVEERCPSCQALLDCYQIEETPKKFALCGNYPICHFYEIVPLKGHDLLSIPQEKVICPECHQESMSKKTGRFGSYMLCEECKTTRKILKDGTVAPKNSKVVALPELACLRRSDDHYLLREGSSGLFLAASKFPKVREARAITIAELQRFQDRLPEEWAIYASAPAQDPEGNPTILRFNRKSKKQYAASKKGEKWTKFIFDYH